MELPHARHFFYLPCRKRLLPKGGGDNRETDMRGTIIITATLLALGATSAFAQQGVTGSTNGYTAAQRSTAEAAVKAAGFNIVSIVSYQGGSMFVRGEKGGTPYIITVTADGKVYPSAGGTTAMPGDKLDGAK
jgi:hypothetical protein